MSTHPTLTLQQAEALLTEVAAEYPDRVVTSGRYAVDRKPSCLVGNVLHRAGWSIDDLDAADKEDGGDPCAVDYLTESLARFAGLTPDAARLLHVAQTRQDHGAPWAEAATAALAGDAA